MPLQFADGGPEAGAASAVRWSVTIHAMHCPFCRAEDTRVIDSRLVASGEQVRRRRECQSCAERFTTYESAELLMPRVIKSNGAREPFDEDKLRSGLVRALEKRPVSLEELDTILNRIQHDLRATGERELPSRSIGEAVMEQLKRVDQVAYVRFASVYRDFQDISQFQDEVAKLKTEHQASLAAEDADSRAVASEAPFGEES